MNITHNQGQPMMLDGKEMNIIERTALWYRLERIGYVPPEPEPTIKPPSKDMVLQLKAEVVGWREKHSKILLELDTLKEKSSIKRSSEESYTVEGEC